MSKLRIKKLSPTARIPKRNSDFAAGYDLYTTDLYELRAGERHLYKTGLAMAIPTGLYGRIAPRSGLAFKNGIDVMAGVIDEDYRDEVGVILINMGDAPWKPDPAKGIAQIIFENYSALDVTESDVLPTSTRTGGFGSTDEKQLAAETSIAPRQDIPIKQGRSSLTTLYEKSGGILVKTPYSEEMKSRIG